VRAEDAATAALLKSLAPLAAPVARASEIVVGVGLAKPAAAASAVLEGATLFVPLAGVIDLGVERRRLEKERERLANLVAATHAKLGNASFVERAKPEVVQAERDKLASLESDAAKVESAIADLAE
jgi:valyl-tRNA synthetase